MGIVTEEGDEDVSSQGSAARALPVFHRQVQQLDGQQAESLDRMQEHLCVGGAGHLDFSAMERLLALRPLLSLKLHMCRSDTGQQSSAEHGGAIAGHWREWKVAAIAAV